MDLTESEYEQPPTDEKNKAKWQNICEKLGIRLVLKSLFI